MSDLRDNYKVAYINSATTTQVDTGLGSLIRIIVGTTSAGAISIIDDVAGTTANIGTLVASIPVGSYEFGIAYANGLRIVTAGASLITVVFDPHT